MKLEDSSSPQMTPTNSSPNLLAKQANNKLIRQASTSSGIQRRDRYMTFQRRQSIVGTNNDQPSTFSVPLLAGAMNEFFQATKIMEDEIMLPSRLKDMAIEELVLDNSVQPPNWHELYTFVRDMRNQLARSRPFIDSESSEKQEIKEGNEDEGILLASNYDTQHSSSSSSTSSDEFEPNTLSNGASFDTIKDDLKNHFFGLLGSLDNLKTMANRVTEKYREDSAF
jgi:hypothetical protein